MSGQRHCRLSIPSLPWVASCGGSTWLDRWIDRKIEDTITLSLEQLLLRWMAQKNNRTTTNSKIHKHQICSWFWWMATRMDTSCKYVRRPEIFRLVLDSFDSTRLPSTSSLYKPYQSYIKQSVGLLFDYHLVFSKVCCSLDHGWPWYRRILEPFHHLHACTIISYLVETCSILVVDEVMIIWYHCLTFSLSPPPWSQNQ